MTDPTADGRAEGNEAGFAIFGGSFDPVHSGHVAVATAVLASGRFRTILFVPARKSPLKDGAHASGAHREAMLRLAIQDNPRFEIDTCELERIGPSFTVDTVKLLREKRRPRGSAAPRPGLIIGSDLIPEFGLWKNANELESCVDLIVVARPGAEPGEFPRTHRVIHSPGVDISSSAVRDRVRHGLPVSGLVPEAVAQYIEQHRLYR
jgi:nicotinate-nucleotide adenylyltransferase